MAIEVSDDTVWKAVFGVFTAGIGFAGVIWWKVSEMATALKDHEKRIDAHDEAFRESSKKTSATHDIVVALSASMSHMEKDLREIKDAFLGMVKERVK